MTRPDAVEALIELFHARRPIRAGSLILTVYGDAVAPRGGALWLGSLIEILGAMRIADGVVRTAMSRLANDCWLERTRIGRNSHYRLSAQGRRVFDAATRRIYFAAPGTWDGTWSLAVLNGPSEMRAEARARLDAAGFGALAPNVMLRPHGPDPLPSGTDLMLLEARGAAPDDARRLAAAIWPLDDLAARYRLFLDHFAGLAPAAASALAPLDALVVRILLIHEYRRVILRDPLLPLALLPEDWPGTAARALCGRLYRAVRTASEAWIDANGVNADGPLPAPDAAFAARFRDIV
jgi:phenylacetic acid degradation operon negative regulatory protein